MTFSPWQARAAAAGSGLLLAAAFPPLNWWPLVFVAMVPVLLAAWSARKSNPRGQDAYAPGEAPGQGHGRPARDSKASAASPPELSVPSTPADQASRSQALSVTGFWRGFRLGWIFGFVFFLGTMWWVAHVSLPGMLILCAYLALYPAIALGLAAWLGMSPAERWFSALGKIFLIAAAWCGLEWVRGVALSGFTWNLLAVPLFPMAGMRHLSAFTGVTGLGLIAALVPLLISACLRLQRGHERKRLIIVAAFSAGWIGMMEFSGLANDGMLNAKVLSDKSPWLTALLVQPNVTMEDKMSPEPEVQRQRYLDLLTLTDNALASTAGEDGQAQADLVIWPESAIPGLFDDALTQGAFAPQLAQGNFTLVTGADSQEWDELHNSVAALRGTVENHALHDKICLVPFGEFIPFRHEIPLLEKMLGGLIPLDFSPGKSFEPMKPEGQPFEIVPLICFEDTIGRHARKFIRPGPQVLVNVTNDNWFAESPATEIHFVNARWRAPELNRTLLRSANTGVTASVTPEGKVEALPSFQKGVLSCPFTTHSQNITFYAAHGDIVSQTAGAAALLATAGLWLQRFLRRRLQPHPIHW